jgi:general secretion pathway protein M
MRALSRRERRLIAMLLLVALVALVQLAIIGPIIGGFSARAERREALRLTYQHNAGTIAGIPRLRRLAERQQGLVDAFTLAAPSSEAGGELLKERLQAAVEKAGGEFRGSEGIVAPRVWAGARVNARLSQPQLVALIAALENARPYLVVSALLVTADEALLVRGPSQLDVQIEATIPLRAAATK